jgi:hypothetical protein
MKALFPVLMLVSLNAFASPDKIEARCHSAGVADAGYSVTVSRSLDGKLTARVYTVSFMGSELIGEGRVERLGQGGQITYKNLDLTLDISPFPGRGGGLPGKISGNLIPSDVFTDLFCSLSLPPVVMPELPDPGRNVCMAYHTGAIFDAEANRCFQIGTSGCSNPFEFREVSECLKAYSMSRE